MKPDLVLANILLESDGWAIAEAAYSGKSSRPPARFQRYKFICVAWASCSGRQADASREIDKMASALAAYQQPVRRKTVALYYANSYTSGRGTLVDEAVRLAGLDNLADKAGVSGSAPLSLEKLVLEKPDILVRSSRERAPALAFRGISNIRPCG